MVVNMAAQLRVLHITPNLFVPGRMGGGERYVQQLVHAQIDLGLSVQVVAVVSFQQIQLESGAPTVGLMRGFKRLLKLARQTDIIHVHQLNTQGFDLALLLARLSGTPLVLTDHGGDRYTPGRLLGSRRLAMVSAVAAVSPFSLRDIDPKGIARRSEVIWGGGDHLTGGATNSNRTDVLFVGRLLPHKGIHILIEALPAQMSLRIVGETRDAEYRRSLQQLANNKDVVFEGAPADGQLRALYQASDVLVLPSVEMFEGKRYRRPELLGLVVLESLAAGTPVIGSSVGGLAELLQLTWQTSVAPGNVDALREALVKGSFSLPPQERLSDLTWSATARRCLSLYQELATAHAER